MTKTGVVYLCRFAEGEEPVHRFLDSYRRHPAGLDHDLHVILKGFPDREARDRVRAMFGTQPINTIELDDAGYDIGSYFAAARAVGNPQLLFLNTFSEILADDWLERFDKALASRDVGLVGATGSWQSGSSGYEAVVFRALRRLKGPRHFRDSKKSTVLADRDDAKAEVHAPINFRRVLRKLPRLGLYPLRLYQFGRHPNPHIRTNAFFIKRDLFLDLRAPTFRKKMHAYKFESGRHSMTKQIVLRGLKPVVVDRLGKIYEVSDWKSSSTFWIDIQGNLLIADNQTKNYAAGSVERRRLLKNHAWDNPRAWDMA